MSNEILIVADTLLTCKGDGKPKVKDDLGNVHIIKDGAVYVKDGIIKKVGKYTHIKEEVLPVKTIVKEKIAMPGFVDSHTHPVFAGNRVEEFIMRAKGATYQEIHASGGGIQFTVDATTKASFEELVERGKKVLLRMLACGTTTVEAKSGYGLSTNEEIKQLKVIKKLQEETPLDVIPTFLGAHSIPREYKENPDEYVKIVIDEMLPKVKEEKLAQFVDVFCEEGAFTLEQTRIILQRAKDMGFGLKLHAEEFTNLGGAVMASKMGAISVDHLLMVTSEDIEILSKTNTILTLMPGTLFFLDYHKYAPAREMIDKGAKVSLATDFNAGSCLSASIPMAMSLACIKMKMTPEEAINSATYNASFAVGKERIIGSIEEGKQADIILFDVEDYRLIPYYFGENLVKMVIKKGKIVVGKI